MPGQASAADRGRIFAPVFWDGETAVAEEAAARIGGERQPKQRRLAASLGRREQAMPAYALYAMIRKGKPELKPEVERIRGEPVQLRGR